MKHIIAIIKQKNKTLVFYFENSELKQVVLDFSIHKVIRGLCEYYHTSFEEALSYMKKKTNFKQKVPIFLCDSIYFPTQGNKNPQAWINFKYISDVKAINGYQSMIVVKPFMLIPSTIEYKILISCSVRVIKRQIKRCEDVYKESIRTKARMHQLFQE